MGRPAANDLRKERLEDSQNEKPYQANHGGIVPTRVQSSEGLAINATKLVSEEYDGGKKPVASSAVSHPISERPPSAVVVETTSRPSDRGDSGDRGNSSAEINCPSKTSNKQVTTEQQHRNSNGRNSGNK